MKRGRPKKNLIEKIKDSEGLGDIINIVTDILHIPKCDECEERRIKLNQMFSFIKQTSRRLTEDEIKLIEAISLTNKVTDSKIIFDLYNEIFSTHINYCNCAGVVAMFIEKLSKVAEHDKTYYNKNS